MRRPGSPWVLVIAPIVFFAGRAVAQEDQGSPDLSFRSRRTANFAFDVAIARRYDDNILRLSRCDLASVEQGIPRLPCPGDPSHRASHAGNRLVSADDNVTLGEVQVRGTMRPFPHRNTVASASFDVYRYSRNSIKNWLEWKLALAQELSASRRHLTLMRASVAYVPSYYSRELRDDAASLEAGVPIYASDTYSQLEYGLSVEQEIVNNRLHALVGGERQSRNHDTHNERDSDRTTWSVGLRGRPFAHSRTQAALSYGWGQLTARGDLESTFIPERDISYDHHLVELDIAIAWGDAHRGRVELLAKKETREFTTADKYDVYRYGRVDDRSQYRVRVVQRVAAFIDVQAEWSRYENDAGLGIASVDPTGEVTGFVQNRYTVNLRFHVSTQTGRRDEKSGGSVGND